MKKKFLGLLMTLTIVAASGCSVVPTEGVENAGSAGESASDEASSEDTAEETGESAADTAEADASASDSQEQGQDESGQSAEASSEAEYNPEEIVEPEITQEETNDPVSAEQLQQMTGEVSVEDDGVMQIVFMGDSQFDNARGTGSEIPAYTCTQIDNCRFYNLAAGGTAASVERTAGTAADELKDVSFVSTCYALAGKLEDADAVFDGYAAKEEIAKVDPSKVDFYIIEYGANDYLNGKDIYNPESSYDVHTYLGALTIGVDVLRSISPNAKIIICGPSYCMFYNADGFSIGDSYMVSKGIGPLSEYADACANFAEDEDIMYIDSMYHTWFDLTINNVDSYLSDGLHYTEKGRQIYAKTLAHFIKKQAGLDDSELPYLQIDNFDFYAD